MKYVYTVWFGERSLPKNDPDAEWPACFIIEGTSVKTAQAWGDCVAINYAKVNEKIFVSSVIDPVALSNLPGINSLPVVQEGVQPTDDEIGW